MAASEQARECELRGVVGKQRAGDKGAEGRLRAKHKLTPLTPTDPGGGIWVKFLKKLCLNVLLETKNNFILTIAQHPGSYNSSLTCRSPFRVPFPP